MIYTMLAGACFSLLFVAPVGREWGMLAAACFFSVLLSRLGV